MNRNYLIEALKNSKLLESRNAAFILEQGAEYELFEGLASAREECLALTYRLRLKAFENQNDDYSQRLTSSLKEFIEILERDDPEFLRIITVKENTMHKYHIWLRESNDDIVGCMYTAIVASV